MNIIKKSPFNARNYLGCFVFAFLAYLSIPAMWGLISWFLTFLPVTYIHVGKFTLVLLALFFGLSSFIVFTCFALLFLVMDL